MAFNEEYYLANNPDVAMAVKQGLIGSGWQHYQLVGKAEGRSFAEPSGYGTFNEEYYLANNPDVAKAVERGDLGSGWQHYKAMGLGEGRSAQKPADYGDFNEEYYLANNPDVAAVVKQGVFGTGWEHYQAFGQTEGRSYATPLNYGDFNEEWYLANNPDVAMAVEKGQLGSGWQHYKAIGLAEGRSYANPYDETSGGKTFTLTPGVDSGAAFTGTDGNDTYNAVPFVGTTGTKTDTFTALDALDGGKGDDTLNVVSESAAYTIPTSATVKDIETANITVAGTFSGDVSGWSGLTAVNVTQAGGAVAAKTNSTPFDAAAANANTLTAAAATTDVTLTDTAAADSTTSVQGGKNVKVTLNGVTKEGILNVGTISAPTGTVDVTTNMLASQTGTNTADAINVTGGTSVNVTANLTEKAGLGNTVTGGDIAVNGNAATATVTVKQSAAAIAADKVEAVTGVVKVDAVTAAPGQDGVKAVSGVTPQTAKAAVAGVINGKVTVTDSAAAGGLGSIKTVTLENYGKDSKIESNALTDLTLKGTAGTLTLDRDGSLGASDTLNLTLDTLSAASQNNSDSTISDANNEIKTLNVTTKGGNSTLTAFTDSALTTLNVAGDHVLTMGTVNSSLTKLAVSGAAGFTGDVSSLGAALAFTTTSSGKITATMDAATQKFAGSTGQTDITISADAKVAISGGSGGNDKLVLNNSAATFNTASNVADGKGLTKMVSGFEVLGTGAASQGTFDISTLPSGLKAISMDGKAAGDIAFTKLAPATTLGINASQDKAVTYQLADANGVANTANLTLGGSTNKTGLTIADLTLKDANDVGPGTLNVTSNATTWLQKNTITKLTDNGLSNLVVSGSAGLEITGLAQTDTQATSFTINNALTGADDAVKIGTLTNANLGTLTFTGGGNSSIGSLDGLAGKVLTVSNTGTGKAAIDAIATSGTSGGTYEINTVSVNDTLALGEALEVNGVKVQNTSSVTAISAQNVAIALSGGSVASGLTRTGTASTDWTATVTTTDTISYKAATVGDKTNLTVSETVVAAATAVAAGSKTDGDGTSTHESVTWNMQALKLGQSVTIDGLTLTALRDLSANEVASGFAAITVTGDNSSVGNYAESGSLQTTATWTAASWVSNTGQLNVSSGGLADETDVALTPTVSAQTDITDSTVTEVVKGTDNASSAQALTTITMNGDVAWGANDNTKAATAIGATTGITVDGATNDAHVNITLNAAVAGATNTIKLGNANNYITDTTSAGHVVIEVGSGGNLIDIDQGAASTYLATLTLGSHTNTSDVFNKILVSHADGQATSYSTVITGATKGDVIVFTDNNDIVWDAVTAGEQASITGAANLAGAVTLAFGTLGTAHSATSFTYGTDTYLIENVAADTTFNSGTDSIIKLTGTVVVADNGTNAGEVVIV
ncbi:beta strand repeat-containing protein [Imhoffiella purpurea]|uniref:Uncharacterized protein n=1 Tax=Imhoffiella purpurea TaxID=1249627 RepID=W9VG60_9GAMM|nr:hypothetical protein [Imhoffiella purpurea]EXJ15981.1 hypothetical protein D779_0729 [Imhoffiella purpurea]